MNPKTRLTALVMTLLFLLGDVARAEEYSKKILKTIGKSMSEYNYYLDRTEC